MKATFLAISLLFVLSKACQAREIWEMCLDEGDFSFSTDSFLKSARVAKSGCIFHFTEIGGKGKKFEVNVCDALTRIDRFDSIDAAKPTKLFAGSNGCPAPLFGADFDLAPGTGPEYTAAKQELFETFELVKKNISPRSDEVDLNHVKSVAHASSDVKLTCAQYLLDGYLSRCEAFTAAPALPVEAKEGKPVDEKNLPPGILPQTILRPSKTNSAD